MEPALHFLVRRTIVVGGATVELCVTRAIAEEWNPHWRDRKPHLRDKRQLALLAEDRACVLVRAALRDAHAHTGSWRATFPGGDRVELAQG